MQVYFDPNQKCCPLCDGEILIEDGFISCDTCTANFGDPKWARSADEMHEVTFENFEEQVTAAGVMLKLYNLSVFMRRSST